MIKARSHKAWVKTEAAKTEEKPGEVDPPLVNTEGAGVREEELKVTMVSNSINPVCTKEMCLRFRVKCCRSLREGNEFCLGPTKLETPTTSRRYRYQSELSLSCSEKQATAANSSR